MASEGSIPTTRPRTPLEEAQELMYDAFEADGHRRIELAREALSISGDCADAYVLLAEEYAGSIHEALALYEAGVRAGERAIGEEKFEEFAGHFWGMLETRPYMRARAGLAICLWELGKRQEAINHYQDMLRLNPGDNQGIRYTLAVCLLENGLDKDMAQLLEAYKDDASAAWQYNHAFFLFRKKRTGAAARKKLEEALKFNPHVPGYLLGQKQLPDQLPSFIGFGDENEAIDYVLAAGYLWLEEEGALAWLERISSSM
jgi:tetratricopeptide (TPR) repeat protein